MTIVKTGVLGATRDDAKHIRFAPTGSITATNVQDAIDETAAEPPAITPTPVDFADSPYTVPANVSYLAVNTSGGAITINLGAAEARNGVALIIKDVSGDAAANNITINPDGAETIDELASIAVNVDFGGFHLQPQTGGYAITP